MDTIVAILIIFCFGFLIFEYIDRLPR